MNTAELSALAGATAAVGALGGLGGAVLLVPVLTLSGFSARSSATLGLVSVAAGSLAAAPVQLRERTVNHRLGVTTELAASAGAVAGALASSAVGDRALSMLLGVVALAAAVLGGRRKGIRNLPDPHLTNRDVGEHIGALSGAYPLNGAVVPYAVRRLPAGLGIMSLSGIVAGLAGASGGFLKTPATSEIMTVPVKVAAATTSFTVGVTAATALLVHAAQGRIDSVQSCAVIAGSLIGGRAGALVQSRISPVAVRRALSLALVVVGVVLLVRR